jgi:hypothetical protein
MFNEKETAMSQSSSTVNAGQSVLFKIGWVILLVAAALMTVNHLGLIFVLNDPILFLGWGLFTLYALVVIAVPYRHLEKWAWYITWLLPAGLAAGGFTDPDISLFYYAFAAACVLGLLLTVREFFAVERRVSQRVS